VKLGVTAGGWALIGIGEQRAAIVAVGDAIRVIVAVARAPSPSPSVSS
jgi:hypothetical protein